MARPSTSGGGAGGEIDGSDRPSIISREEVPLRDVPTNLAVLPQLREAGPPLRELESSIYDDLIVVEEFGGYRGNAEAQCARLQCGVETCYRGGVSTDGAIRPHESYQRLCPDHTVAVGIERPSHPVGAAHSGVSVRYIHGVVAFAVVPMKERVENGESVALTVRPAVWKAKRRAILKTINHDS